MTTRTQVAWIVLLTLLLAAIAVAVASQVDAGSLWNKQ
jgi:hypothetical protein